MARFKGMGVDIRATLQRIRSGMEEKGYKIQRTLTGATSFLIEYKEPGFFGLKGTVSVKGTPDNFTVSGIKEDDEQVWSIVEDALKASAANPQALRSHREKEQVKTPAAPTAATVMFCRNCGKEISPDFKLCPYCGAPAKGAKVEPRVAELKPRPTSCIRCWAPLSVSLEDVIITCQYCGNTITVATHEEIKKHSMLENRLHSQEAIEAAKSYMDKGIFRRGIAEKARITNVKLRYVPFWTFPVDAETYYRGRRGLGVSELREMKHAVTDKKRSRWSKFGKIAKAAGELAIEGYMAKERSRPQFRTVSNRFSSHYNWTTLARRTMLSDINYYEVPLERKMPFDSGRISRDAEFFNTELREDEAKGRVRAEVGIKQRELVGEDVDSIDECTTTVRFGDGELIHAPVWFVHYKLGEEDYAVAVDGSTGKVLGGGRPLFKVI